MAKTKPTKPKTTTREITYEMDAKERRRIRSGK